MYNKRTKTVMESINMVIDDIILEKSIGEDGEVPSLKTNDGDGNMSQCDDGERQSPKRSLFLLHREWRLDQLKGH